MSDRVDAILADAGWRSLNDDDLDEAPIMQGLILSCKCGGVMAGPLLESDLEGIGVFVVFVDCPICGREYKILPTEPLRYYEKTDTEEDAEPCQ